MKKLLGFAAVILVVVGLAYAGWKNDWFYSSPSSTITRALMQANAGNYEAACNYLPTVERKQLLEDADFMKEVWDRITKNRTIQSVEFAREDRGPNGKFGDIEVFINYIDEPGIRARTKIACADGQWKFGAREINNAVVARQRKQFNVSHEFPTNDLVFERHQLELAKEYVQAPDAQVSLRLPKGAQWNSKEKAYEDPRSGLVIQIQSKTGRDSFASLVRFVEEQWASPDHDLEQRRNLTKDKLGAILFEGDAINIKTLLFKPDEVDAKGRGWRLMFLVIGEDARAAVLSTTFPNLAIFRDTMRECLTSVRWERKGSE